MQFCFDGVRDRLAKGATTVAILTRRDLAKTLAGVAATAALRAEDPKPAASGVDHVKLRVANSGASALFYYSLFGGEIISVRNSTLPDSPLVTEFFLKIGGLHFPYLVFAQVRAGELPGLDHISLLVDDPSAVRATLVQRGVSLIPPGDWFHDADRNLLELMSGPSFGIQAQNMRVALPANLAGIRPAFSAASVTRLCLRSADVARSVAFFRSTFNQPSSHPVAPGAEAILCGHTSLEIRPIATAQIPGLDRLIIAINGVGLTRARRVLEQRGIPLYGSRNEVLFRDPDGNELQVIVS
jgi:catechol 2,3-dioxygenase-like lactoylglutathione lyase family enzyme